MQPTMEVYDDASHIMSSILQNVVLFPFSVHHVSADHQNLGLMSYGLMGNDVRTFGNSSRLNRGYWL